MPEIVRALMRRKKKEKKNANYPVHHHPLEPGNKKEKETKTAARKTESFTVIFRTVEDPPCWRRCLLLLGHQNLEREQA